MQKYVNLVDLVKSFLTSIYYFLVNIGFDTANIEPLRLWEVIQFIFSSPAVGDLRQQHHDRHAARSRSQRRPGIPLDLHPDRVGLPDHLRAGALRALLHVPESGRSAGWLEAGQTLQGSFSAVSKPIFPSKYAFESSRRDLNNALLCTVL